MKSDAHVKIFAIRSLTSLCSYFLMLPIPEAVLPRTGRLADVCAAVSGAAAAPSQADKQSGPTLDIFSGGFAEDSAGGRRQDNSGQSWTAVGRMADRDAVPLPAEVRAKLAELELELSEGE